jgi:hypothetical protein
MSLEQEPKLNDDSDGSERLYLAVRLIYLTNLLAYPQESSLGGRSRTYEHSLH